MNLKKLLTGNEAIAEGVIESRVDVITGYPGTPSTEVILNLLPQKEELETHIEWSTNEKVAFEISEKIGGSVFLRSTTDISHVASNVEISKKLKLEKREALFERDIAKRCQQ